MNWLEQIYNYIRRIIKRGYVKYYRQMSKFRITWSLIKLIDSFSKLQLSSAALTYHTLFAIVPVMSLMIAIAKGLGYDELFIQQVRRLFQGQEAVSDYLLLYANSYLYNTKVAVWLGVGIGLILLLYSVFSIFSTIDATFNILWNQKGRSFKKLLKTFAFVMVLPFIVVLALALWWSVSSIFNNAIIQKLNVFIVSVSTYILTLFVAYKFIPNTKVKTNYALLSAVVCGSIFALMQYFSFFIISSFNYRSIYGDLASLMIFLLLIYFSWTVCLAGSKWNYFLQKAVLFNLGRNNYFIAAAPVNFTYENFGLQAGMINVSFNSAGIQTGAINFGGFMQIGLVNAASKVQIGLFNKEGNIQIGLLNHNPDALIPWMPFFNIGFPENETAAAKN